MIELVITLGVVALLASVAITQYSSYADQGRRTSVRQDLDTIRTAIAIEQTTTRRPYLRKLPPPHLLKSRRAGAGESTFVDPFGNPYTVDPQQCIVYSWGQNCEDEQGEGDDIALDYETVGTSAHFPAPKNLRALAGGPPVVLTWTAVVWPQGIKGYLVERRNQGQTDWQTLSLDPVAPEEFPRYSDPAPSTNGPALYRVKTVQKTTGNTSPPSSQVGWVQTQSAAPTLEISPTDPSASPGEPIRFEISARSFGAALTTLKFGPEEFPLDGSTANLQLTRTYNHNTRVRVVVEDSAGNITRGLIIVRIVHNE